MPNMSLILVLSGAAAGLIPHVETKPPGSKNEPNSLLFFIIVVPVKLLNYLFLVFLSSSAISHQ